MSDEELFERFWETHDDPFLFPRSYVYEMGAKLFFFAGLRAARGED